MDETEGLFITLPEDSLDYQKPSSKVVPNPVLKRSPLILKLAQIMEPSVNPNLVGAVVVPDGSIDPSV